MGLRIPRASNRFFSVFEDDERRNAVDAVILGRLLGIIDIDASHESAPFHFGGYFLQVGLHALTWGAPIRREVDERDVVWIERDVRERGVRELDDIGVLARRWVRLATAS